MLEFEEKFYVASKNMVRVLKTLSKLLDIRGISAVN